MLGSTYRDYVPQTIVKICGHLKPCGHLRLTLVLIFGVGLDQNIPFSRKQ